ncbi:MAG: glycosyltransferase [Gammaproteobacteria bacterium]|nr:glycosyltransferase [Gammaproteobacteria bacterium]
MQVPFPLNYSKDVILVSTADWDNPFWTNKQHVACELARRGYRVLYIDSLGLRRPSATAQDLGRIKHRLKKAFRAPQRVRDRLWVWSPLVIPFQKFSLIRSLNRVLLGAGLRFWMWRLGFAPDIFWTYNPMTLQFFNNDGFGCTVYHCVDEIKTQPGMPVEQIEAAESELVRRADVCFVTAEHLLESRKILNGNTHYFSNVADFSHFAKARDEAIEVPRDFAVLPRPVIGFVGAISGYKVDFPLLKTMAERHPDWSIVLVGKVGEGDPWTDVSSLQALSNVRFMGPRDYHDLPACLKAFDVAILPCMLNDYTKSMFPMKFFEYLAAGRPVVATALHALRAHANVAYLAQNTDDFISGVEAALRSESAPLEMRLEVAREQTYECRTERMLRLLPQPYGIISAIESARAET